jgi:hypothetical protein
VAVDVYFLGMATEARVLDSSDLELVDFATEIIERSGDGVVHSVGAAVRDSTGAHNDSLPLQTFHVAVRCTL